MLTPAGELLTLDGKMLTPAGELLTPAGELLTSDGELPLLDAAALLQLVVLPMLRPREAFSTCDPEKVCAVDLDTLLMLAHVAVFGREMSTTRDGGGRVRDTNHVAHVGDLF
jgi:hypothetical protein